MAGIGAKWKRQAPTRRWQRGCKSTDRARVQSTRSCRSSGEATVHTRTAEIFGGKAAPSFSQPAQVFSRPCGSAPLPVQAKRDLPGLPRRDLLSPRGPRVACVPLKRIAPHEGPSAGDTDRLLGDCDDRALHSNLRRPGALDRLQRKSDLASEIAR